MALLGKRLQQGGLSSGEQNPSPKKLLKENALARRPLRETIPTPITRHPSRRRLQ
jgi:hypothetical protein